MFFAVYLVASAFRKHLILDADGIETVGLLRSWRLEYQEIGARWWLPYGYWPSWSIRPKDRTKKAINVEYGTYDCDQVFRNWFDSIPRADNAFWKDQSRQFWQKFRGGPGKL